MRGHASRTGEGAGASFEGWLPRPFARFAGFAFSQAWLVSLCLGKAVCAAPRPLGALVSPTALATCAGVALSSLVVMLLTIRLVPLSRKRGVCAAAALAACCGTGVAALAARGELPPWLQAPACLAAGFGAGVQVLAWQEYFSTAGVRGAVPGMAVASALGAVLFLGVELLPDDGGAAAVCLLPLAGEASRWPRAGTRFYAKGTGDITETDFLGAERHLLSNMLHDYSPRLFALCALVSLAFSCGCATMTPDIPVAAGPGGAFLVCLAGLGMCAACVAGIVWAPQATMRFFYAALPLLMADALLKGLAIPRTGTVSLVAGAAGMAISYCLVWALMVGIARQKHLPALGLIAILHASCLAGASLGLLAARLLPDPAVQAPLVMFAALGAGALLFAGFNGAVTVTREMFSAPAASRQELAVLALAERAHLTPRETEVLQVWMAGHNAAYVEETLHISRNTVKTHLNHIYQKTGTSGREDLLALLEATEPGR